MPKNINKEIIALFSGQSNSFTVPKLYVQLTGSISLGIVLNQAVFWSNKSELKDDWFYKPYQEWFEEIGVPERSLRRYFDFLEEKKWLQTKVKKIKGLNTKHIRPNIEKIIESISSMLSTDSPNRPTCPDEHNATKNCINSDPTGQNGLSEPANLSDHTIYTDNNKQINTNISISGENAESSYTESDGAKGKKEKSDYFLENQESVKDDRQRLETKGEPPKSDYFDNHVHTKNTSKIECKQNDADIKILFDKFYSAYPKKRDKESAFKAFKKLKPTPEFVDMLLADITKRLSTVGEWQDKDKQFIPHPATYLNKKRWEDEITISTTSSTQINANERAANEQKIRERERRAAEEKRKEIEDSKKLKGIMSEASQKARSQLREMVGLPKREAYSHGISHAYC